MGLSVSEYISVSIAGGAAALSISVSEAVAVQDAKYTVPQTAALTISVHDDLTVSDVITAKLAQYNISVSEAVGVTDSPTVQEQNYLISKAEAVGVVEAPTVQLGQYLVTPAQAVGVTDVATVALGAISDGSISVNQPVAVTDVATVQLDRYNVSVAEAVGVSDAPTVQEPNYYVSVSEAITVRDAVASVTVTSAATLTVSIADAVGVTSAPTVSRQAALPNNYYSTNFPETESTLSEGGVWLNGQTDGVDWLDCRSNGSMGYGYAYTGYNDSTALLKGTWANDQECQGTVKITGTITGICEVQLRLRSSISANVNSGYEILFNAHPGGGYGCQLARWNGPKDKYDTLDNTADLTVGDGDIVRARIVGTVITVWLNGSPLTFVGKGTAYYDTAGDSAPTDGSGGPARYSSGRPGIGFYPASGQETLAGFSHFEATQTAADLSVSTSEAVGVSDSVTNLRLTPLFVSVSEAVAAAESGITVSIESASTLTISKFEAVGVTESTALLQPTLPVSVSESVGVTDAVSNIGLTPLKVSVSELVAVTDAPTVAMGAAGDLNVSKFETVTVRESVTATVPFLVVAVSEAVGVADAPASVLLRQFNVQVAEAVGVQDAVADIGPFPGGVIAITVAEAVAVSTSPAVGHETATHIAIRKPGRFVLKDVRVAFRM